MFRITFVALKMDGIHNAVLAVYPDKAKPIELRVEAGGFAEGDISFHEQATFDFQTTLFLNEKYKSTIKVKQVPTNGGLHVQVIGPWQRSGRPVGIGHILHTQ